MKALVIIFKLIFFVVATTQAEETLGTDKNVSTYKVNPGDVISIHIWNEEELTRPEVLVRPDGFISVPILGDIMAGGQTVPNITKKLVDGLNQFLKDEPVVTISLVSISGNTIYVLGKVNRPGQFVLHSSIDVTQALTLAGGLNNFADEDNIKILRRDKSGTQTSIKFDYSYVKKGNELHNNIILQSGDIVLVP